MIDTLQPLVQDFFEQLDIKIDELTVSLDTQDTIVNINLKTPDSPLIIGMHGKNIGAFQHLLGRMVEKKLWKFIHLHLEVNDYIKQKNERLYRFLESKISVVTRTWESIKIPNLTPYERKRAHDYITEKNITWLKTHSEWLSRDRVLIVSYTGEPIKNESQESIVSWWSLGDDLPEDGVGI